MFYYDLYNNKCIYSLSKAVMYCNAFNHKDIKEEDILTTNMPRVRINGTGWMGFAGTHQKFTIVRASADGTPKIVDGVIEVDAHSYKLGDYKVKRKVVKKKKWIVLNAEFDPDWNMSENTQNLFVYSTHNISGSVSVEVSAKAGFKLEKGKIVPSVEATITPKLTLKFKSAKLRVKQEISRRHVLATIVGNGTSGKTYKDPDSGVVYNLKNVGIMDYYFKHYYTKLSN